MTETGLHAGDFEGQKKTTITAWDKKKIFPGNNVLLNRYRCSLLLPVRNVGVPVSEQNIEVHSKHCTVTKDTFGSCDVWIRGRESNGKHKTFNVLPSDPDLHFAFTLCLSTSPAFCFVFWPFHRCNCTYLLNQKSFFSINSRL